MPQVLTKTTGRTGVITFNNPEKRNALSSQLLEEFSAAMAHMAAENIFAVIIRAQKDSPVWSAGFDIGELANKDPLAENSPLEKALLSVENYPGAVIAMLHGGAWGGACELALACDLAIGDETAAFAITPAKIGLPYNAAGIKRFIDRAGLALSKEMFFTAKPIAAERALACGLLNRLVKAAELESFTLSLAGDISSLAPLAVTAAKKYFRALSRAVPPTPAELAEMEAFRKEVLQSVDFKNGVSSFLLKKQPVFIGR